MPNSRARSVAAAIAALLGGILGPRYAPDVPITGVAAFAPAPSWRRPTASTTRMVKFDDVVRPEARDIARRIADLCQFDPQDIPTLQDLTKQLNGAQVLTDPTAGPFGQRLKENAPDAPIGVPLLIGQGLADVVVYPRGQSGRSRRRPHVRFSRSGPARMGVK